MNFGISRFNDFFIEWKNPDLFHKTTHDCELFYGILCGTNEQENTYCSLLTSSGLKPLRQ